MYDKNRIPINESAWYAKWILLLIYLNFTCRIQSSEGSWDINSNDPDPMPRADDAGLNHHGTR